MISIGIISIFLAAVMAWVFYHRKSLMPSRKNIISGGRETGQPAVLEEAEADSVLTNIPGFLCLKNPNGQWLRASPTCLEIYGLTGNECIGQSDFELSQNPTSAQDALRNSAARDQEVWDMGRPACDVHIMHSADGNNGDLHYELTRTPIFDHTNKRYRLLMTGSPVQCTSIAEPNIYASVFYLNKLPFLLLNSDLIITDINDAFTVFSGFTKKDALGKYFIFWAPQVNAKKYVAVISAFLRQNPHQPWSGEAVCHCKNGRVVPVKLIISRIVATTEDKQETYYFAYLSDNRKQKEDERRLLHITHYDDLTGLPNRTLFLEQLTRALFLAARHKLHSSVLYLDLDRFKSVNESFGHEVGNALLKEVSARLTEVLRKEDMLARFNSDEFAIMSLNAKSHEDAIVASSMVAQHVISKLAKSFYLANQEVYVSVSVGIAVFPEDAHNAEALLKNADIAMHEAKKLGSNNVHFFQKQYTSKARDRHQLESNLRQAIHRKELRLYYQPQYDADSQALCGAEVLIRWLQGQTKLISPYFFIDVAEETGFIIPMGKWILETACKQLQAWLDAGYGLRQVSVNVSARQFMDPHFVETVEGALSDSGLPPECLELEITESMLIGDPKRIELQLKRFKKMGITIALDDFGTGYSSLAYLKNFPIDVVKIDQSFVRGMTPGSTDARIVCAIIEMGHSLGYKVVAEGVENQEQYLFLQDKGCDIIQGYYFSKPLPTGDMARLLGQPR